MSLSRPRPWPAWPATCADEHARDAKFPGLSHPGGPVHHRPVPRLFFTPQLARFTATPEADDGRHLLMGSTTGGLRASADAGEHWHTVSQTLPLIFALRLG